MLNRCCPVAAGWLDEEECHCDDAATAEAMINALRKVLIVGEMSFCILSAKNIAEFEQINIPHSQDEAEDVGKDGSGDDRDHHGRRGVRQDRVRARQQRRRQRHALVKCYSLTRKWNKNKKRLKLASCGRRAYWTTVIRTMQGTGYLALKLSISNPGDSPTMLFVLHIGLLIKLVCARVTRKCGCDGERPITEE